MSAPFDARPLTAEDFAKTESASLPASVNPLADGVFMKHQRSWLEDRSALKICEKGRRTGITFAQAWDDTLTAASARSAGGMNCFYIGDTKEKGLEYIGYVRHFAECIGEQLQGLDEYLFEDQQPDGTTRYITAYRARFASGFRVEALSSRPANIRGLQGSVTIDEAAFHPDVKGVIAAATALLIWGGRVRIISSHNGVRAEAAGAWLSYDIILACEDERAGKPELYAGGPALIGNDIARRGDLWVAWVWELVGDIFWCREIVTLRNATFAVQDAEMDRLMARYKARAAMDQTGMGEKPVEDAKTRYPGRVEGVILNGPIRLNVATIAKMAFEDKKVRIPAGEQALRDDLHKLQRVVGETGNPRLVAESDESGHADRFWAAALGLAANDNRSGGLIDFYKSQVAKSSVATAALAQIRNLLGTAKRAA